MVEFDTLENASKGRSSLHGADIYSNCCTMKVTLQDKYVLHSLLKVEYSKLETLQVRENGQMAWDFRYWVYNIARE